MHTSPSPLEGILGFYRYSDVIKNNISRTHLGRLLNEKYSESQIEEFMENLTVFFNGQNPDLFGICEQKNADKIAQIIKGLKNMIILAVNDDGFQFNISNSFVLRLRELGHCVYSFFPEHNFSGAGSSIILSGEIAYYQMSSLDYVVQGTPTNCCLLGL